MSKSKYLALAIIPGAVVLWILFSKRATLNPSLSVPASVALSSATAPISVQASGKGFAANSHIQFGYSPIPPSTNVLIDTISDIGGNWAGEFTSPYTAGTYNVMATDATGNSAMGSFMAVAPTGTGSSGNASVTIPPSVSPSTSTALVSVAVSGLGFTPNSAINFGYTPVSTSTNRMVTTTTDANGNWAGVFSAPFTAKTYNMQAVDAAGITVNVVLTVI